MLNNKNRLERDISPNLPENMAVFGVENNKQKWDSQI